MISQLFNKYVYIPTSEKEWIAECKRFMENCEIPSVGTWDGFHVHVSNI